ncbi:hypothetical protein [Nonomuraea gerenzanensis]|nr:hypothetical protein [Nonomuraea gerenzanensis]UBU16093.1 hypothetical protein LCN96_14100 [Nonomuraea gerenzanensis]
MEIARKATPQRPPDDERPPASAPEPRPQPAPPPDSDSLTELVAGEEDQPAGGEDEGGGPAGHPLLRWAVGVLANVTVLTGLLVYFGWQRSEIQALELGIDDSVLGMSPTDYVLRSVRQALTLLLVVAIGGLAWLQLDHVLRPRVLRDGTTDEADEAAPGKARSRDRLVTHSLRFMSWAWLVLPLACWALGFVEPLLEIAFLIFPFSIGVGALLTLYGTYLRSLMPGRLPRTSMPLRYAFTAIIVCVSLFYGAGNYATVLGVSLAENMEVDRLARVRVYSTQRLNLAAGQETTLPGSTGKDDYRYRYTGLRLLLHTSKGYFLVAENWRPQQGVVIILQESSTVRLELGA